ncbi:hypothetical protein A0J52_10005 [Clostridium sporogenes]|uniref:hypothetical protein n=1 Tax=Clostridium sporogenes TaxID=1509 RepID=UPI0007800EB0|nr:hypothetical protein [Clostridium sporogenes]KYN77185.1 hypothetical protein A0J52_10005 [Clostridium sporogenes]
MGNIAEKANDIRSKTYGKDVREALASGLEEINYVAETSNNTANKAKTIAESVTAAENQRIQNENIRKKSEETRVGSENTRIQSEKNRVSNEDERIKKETIRVKNEETRVTNEDKRLLSEKERESNENSRKSNESTRIQAEKQRGNNENIRIDKENERVKNEQNRVVAENSRQVSEQNRVIAEEERVKEWNLIKNSYEDESAGDMKKIIYDKNNDGVVDLAEKCISSYTKGEVDKMVTDSTKSTKDFVVKELKNKVDLVQGKQLSTEDYTTIEKQKLAGVGAGANNYIHPSAHAPSIITQDANHRFVTDTEKNNWNSKASGNHTHSESDLINIIQSLGANGHRVFPGGLKIVKGFYKTPAGGSDGNNYGVFHKIISNLKLPITFDNKDSMRVFANSNSTWAWANGSASSNSGINLFVSNVANAQANVGIVIDYFVIGN